MEKKCLNSKSSIYDGAEYKLHRFFEPSSSRYTENEELTDPRLAAIPLTFERLKEFAGPNAFMNYKAVASLVERHTREKQLSVLQYQQIVTD